MGLPANSGLDLHAVWRSGPHNRITDVDGIRVGHRTLQDGEIQTGVTAVLPHTGNIYRNKVVANASVLNGFGKSIGVLQVQELGTIETPIILTNTMSVGTAYQALCRYMLDRNEDIGVTTGTVNCLVTECNDGTLNDIRGMHITEKDVLDALLHTSEDVAEGAVGGGTGMYCLGLKGGIGTASRIVPIDGTDYTIGALVMTNFGHSGNLIIGGRHYDTSREVTDEYLHQKEDKGSIIMLLATDLPLSSRQLKRVCNRMPVALGRTGSNMGNGSGDIAIAWTTANRVPHDPDAAIGSYRSIYDSKIDPVFDAAIEAVEESIISALYHADTTEGVRGNRALGLRDYLHRRTGQD